MVLSDSVRNCYHTYFGKEDIVSKILAFSWHCIDSADMHYCYIVRDVQWYVCVCVGHDRELCKN